MAVRAQFAASNFFLLDKGGEGSRAEMAYPQLFNAFPSNTAAAGENDGQTMMPLAQAPTQYRNVDVFSPPTQPEIQTLIFQDQLAKRQRMISSGLSLDLEPRNSNQNQHQQHNAAAIMSSCTTSSHGIPAAQTASMSLCDGFQFLAHQHNEELHRYLAIEAERLRNAVTESYRRHQMVLMASIQSAAIRKMREKERDMERAAQQTVQLQQRLTQLHASRHLWEARAIAGQNAVVALEYELQNAVVAAGGKQQDEEEPENQAEDAESAFVDPNRECDSRPCRRCWSTDASVVLLPCRHLAVCNTCDPGTCPVCNCITSARVHVLFS